MGPQERSYFDLKSEFSLALWFLRSGFLARRGRNSTCEAVLTRPLRGG